MASTAVSTVEKAVSKMTSVSGSVSLMRFRTVKPSPSGSLKSSRTRSTPSSCRASCGRGERVIDHPRQLVHVERLRHDPNAKACGFVQNVGRTEGCHDDDRRAWSVRSDAAREAQVV